MSAPPREQVLQALACRHPPIRAERAAVEPRNRAMAGRASCSCGLSKGRMGAGPTSPIGVAGDARRLACRPRSTASRGCRNSPAIDPSRRLRTLVGRDGQSGARDAWRRATSPRAASRLPDRLHRRRGDAPRPSPGRCSAAPDAANRRGQGPLACIVLSPAGPPLQVTSDLAVRADELPRGAQRDAPGAPQAPVARGPAQRRADEPRQAPTV